MTISTGLSDFHKMIITVLKFSFIKLRARIMYYKDYKKFSTNSLGDVLTLRLDCINKGFDSFEDNFIKNVNRHAPTKKKLVRANEVPYLTNPLKKAIMKSSDLERKYLKNKSYLNINVYKKQKNLCRLKIIYEGKNIF